MYYQRIIRWGDSTFVLPKRKLYLPGEVVKTTVRELLDNSYGARVKEREYPRCCIYIIRNQNQVLYVGMTNYHARHRIRNHVYSKNSALGQAIREQAPESHSWEVEMIKMADREMALEEERKYIEKLQPLYDRSRRQSN